MRRNFAEVLKSGRVDYKKEYVKLYSLLFDERIESGYNNKVSLYDLFDDNFSTFYFHGTCLSLEEFDEQYGFAFPTPDENISIDDLVS